MIILFNICRINIVVMKWDFLLITNNKYCILSTFNQKTSTSDEPVKIK